jgi:iron complex transport system substrate-binding protein
MTSPRSTALPHPSTTRPGPQDLKARFFTSLGFTTPDEIAELTRGDFNTEVSGERLDMLDHDVLVVFTGRENLQGNPLFQRLNAVREGRVSYLPLPTDLAAAIGFNSPLSLPFAINKMVPKLVAAVDDDPSTPVPDDT